MEYLTGLRRREKIIKVVKITIGAVLAIVIAQLLGLDNYMNAGIIMILSLQSTKRETMTLAMQRLGFVVIALLIAWIFSYFLGFTLVTFGLFLLVFSTICMVTGMTDSIAICAVLVSQIIVAGHMELALVINQSLIFIIGAGVGVLLNLFVTTKVADIQKTQEILDNKIRNLLYQISELLIHKVSAEEIKTSLNSIEETMDKAILYAEELDKNFLLSDYSYYPKYLMFRRNQLSILKEFENYGFNPQFVSQEEEIISDFIKNIAAVFHECNDARDLLEQANDLLINFRSKELPKTRGEFESRAILYGQLSDLSSLLKLKNNFINTLTDEQKGQFWIKCEIAKQ